MHELSVAEALLDSLKRYQRENGGRIKKLALSIGRLGGIDPEALSYAWSIALEANGSRELASCELDVEVLPLRFACRECGGEIESEKLILECPTCRRETLVRAGGRELIMKHIEVEENV